MSDNTKLILEKLIDATNKWQTGQGMFFFFMSVLASGVLLALVHYICVLVHGWPVIAPPIT